MEQFFDAPLGKFLNFQTACKEALNSVGEEAENHRGWHLLSPIFRGILGVLAAMAVIPALIVEYQSTHGFIQTFFVKPKTETSQKMAKIGVEFDRQTSNIANIMKG